MGLIFQILLLYLGAGVGAAVFFFDGWFWLNIVFASIFAALYVLSLTETLFKSNREKYRTQFNALTLLFTQSSFVYSRFYSG